MYGERDKAPWVYDIKGDILGEIMEIEKHFDANRNVLRSVLFSDDDRIGFISYVQSDDFVSIIVQNVRRTITTYYTLIRKSLSLTLSYILI